ncbi:MAG: alpha/beta hydrolase, partial [Pseudomonadota bacterium]
ISAPNPDEDYRFRTARRGPPSQMRVFSSLEEPLKRFRFLPNQPCQNAFLVDYIARTAVKRIEQPDADRDKWTWKFDPGAGRNFDLHFKRDLFLAARCPLAFIYGGDSLFYSTETLSHLKQQTGGRAPIVVIPDAHHHLMMDQPVAFVSALRALFSAWPVRIGV